MQKVLVKIKDILTMVLRKLFIYFQGYSLFAKIHEARGSGQLDRYSQYLNDNARINMAMLHSALTDVQGVVVGGLTVHDLDVPAGADEQVSVRLMYEANPMGWLVEQAGGAATNGRQRILDIQPAQLHERVSVILGSKNEVDRVTSYHSGI